jgi:hypothetical protein
VLVALHLLAPVPEGPAAFPVTGANKVEKPRYMDMQARAHINDTQYFGKVPNETWGHHIGVYQVCHKWLKDRKGSALAYEDITRYLPIVPAIGETRRPTGEYNGPTRASIPAA